MLILDATAHHLVRAFFNLNPSQRQITSARRICQATMKQTRIEEEIAILENHIMSKQLQPVFSLFDHTINNIDTIINKFDNPMEPNESNNLSSDEFDKMKQLKSDIIHQTIVTGRQMIEAFEKTVLNHNQKNYFENPDNESSIKTIENRRLHIIQRANYIKQHKLLIYVGHK